jgi:hypothetical protein
MAEFLVGNILRVPRSAKFETLFLGANFWMLLPTAKPVFDCLPKLIGGSEWCWRLSIKAYKEVSDCSVQWAAQASFGLEFAVYQVQMLSSSYIETHCGILINVGRFKMPSLRATETKVCPFFDSRKVRQVLGDHLACRLYSIFPTAHDAPKPKLSDDSIRFHAVEVSPQLSNYMNTRWWT